MNRNADYHREKFVRKLTEFLYKVSTDAEDTEAAKTMLNEEIPLGFNPLELLKFNPIYAFDKVSYKEKTKNQSYNPLYENNGYNLGSMIIETEKSGKTETNKYYELWLLDNMQLAVTFLYRITVTVSKGENYDRETLEYRCRVKRGEYKFNDKEKFSVVPFITEIIEQVQLLSQGYVDLCALHKNCDNCPELNNCTL